MTEATQTSDEAVPPNEPAPRDPVKRWTTGLLVLSAVLVAYYLWSDRGTPFSSQARVHARVVPVAAEVSGTVTEVLVSNNQAVSAGEVLFRIDATQYALALASAEADLESARQTTGASEAGLVAAQASVKSAQANLARSQQDVKRLRRIKSQDPGALSDRRIESAVATLKVSEQQVVAARAQLEQARRDLGRQGEANARIQQARAAVEQARVDLGHTQVRAPTDGVVTDVRLDKGNFAGAGAPQMTFISTGDIWVQADFTENNLGHLAPGDPVELAFDVYPGRVFAGNVREIAFGVAVDSTPLGSLPSVANNRQWLRNAQRFPVVVDFEMQREERRALRVGAQASVIAYASDNWLLRALGKLSIRISSCLSYAY